MAYHVEQDPGPAGRTCSVKLTVVIEEDRSSLPLSARILVLVWSGAAVGLSLTSALAGLWMIAIFEMLMLAGLCLAFELHQRRPRSVERITLQGEMLRHETVRAKATTRMSLLEHPAGSRFNRHPSDSFS